MEISNDSTTPDKPQGVEAGPHSESFDDTLKTLAERVANRKEMINSAAEKSAENMRQSELVRIKSELRETYTHTEKLQETPKRISTNTVEENYLTSISAEYKAEIDAYLQSAINDGILIAIRNAQKKNDPYFLDVFHDALTEMIHKKMTEKNLL